MREGAQHGGGGGRAGGWPLGGVAALAVVLGAAGVFASGGAAWYALMHGGGAGVFPASGFRMILVWSPVLFLAAVASAVYAARELGRRSYRRGEVRGRSTPLRLVPRDGDEILLLLDDELRLQDAAGGVADGLGWEPCALIGRIPSRPDGLLRAMRGLRGSGGGRRLSQLAGPDGALKEAEIAAYPVELGGRRHWIFTVRAGAAATAARRSQEEQVAAAEGPPLSSVGTVVDVTDRRLGDETLQEVFEMSPVAIWEEDFSAVRERLADMRRSGVTDLSAHLEANEAVVSELAGAVRIVRCNKAGLQIFGAETAAELGGSITAHLAPEAMRSFRAKLVALAAGQTQFEDVVPVIGVRGDRRLVQVRMAVAPSARETWARVFLAFADVTESRRVEGELAAAHRNAQLAAAELAAIMEAAPAAVFIAHDPACASITGNRVTRDWLGLPVGSNVSKSAAPGERPSSFRVLRGGRELMPEELPVQRAARGETVRNDEVDIVTSDGHVRTTLGDAVPLLGAAGEPRGAVGVFLDITGRKQAEVNLRTATDLLLRVQRLGRLGGWELDLGRDQLSWSAETFRIFELEPPPGAPEAIFHVLSLEQRREFRSRIHPGDLDRIDRSFDRSIAEGRLYDETHRIRMPDGRTKVVREVSEIHFAPGGEPARVLGTTLDITEIFTVEEALRDNERRMQAIFDNASAGVAYADADSGLVRANQRLCSMLGYGERELSQLHFSVYTPPEECTVEERFLAEIRAGTREGYRMEKRYVRRDGTVFWGHLALSAVRNRASVLQGFVIVVEDITERRADRLKLETLSRELEVRVAQRTGELRALLDSIPDLVLTCGEAGEVLFCHLPPPQARPPFLADGVVDAAGRCVNPIVQSELAAVLATLGPERGTASRECDYQFEGGSLSVETRAASLGPDRILVVLRDITLRRQTERQSQVLLEKERMLSSLKSQFISIASHELRTPLAAAVNNVELLGRFGERVSDGKRAEVLERVAKSLRRLSVIVADLLTVGRLGAGQAAVSRTTLNLEDFLRGVIHEVVEADPRGHDIALKVAGAAVAAPTDPRLLHHIVANLLTNAVRYSPAGSAIQVSLLATETGFAVEVADEGIGVPEHERERIFEPFVRGSNVGEIGGTGLGLHIVRMQAELMGGNIRYFPRTRGSCFRLDLPFAPPSPAHD